MSSTRPTTSLRARVAELIASGDADAALALVDQLAGERDQLAGERDQLATKLERGWPARRLTELLPHRWAEQRSE